MNATTPQDQNAASEYLPNGKKKVFTLAPVEDDLTFTILNVRRHVLEDQELGNGAKLLFVYVLDKSLNRNLNSQPGVVTISQTKLAEVFGCSQRAIFAWKLALVARGYIWMSRRSMPNTWPIDTYHVTAINPPSSWEEKTTHEGLWGNGERRLADPPLGAREPGQIRLPLPGSRLPGRRRRPKTAKTPDFSGVAGTKLPVSPERSFRCPRNVASGGTGSQLPAAPEENFRRPPNVASGDTGSQLPAAPEENFRHREGEVGGKRPLEIEGRGNPPPPDEQFRQWSKGLEGMFPSKLRRLQADLQQRFRSARTEEARREWERRLKVVEERLLGGTVADVPKPKPVRAAPPPPEDPTPEQVLNSARFLISIGKEKSLTKCQLAALKEAGEAPR